MDARRDYDFDGNNENVLADITVDGVKARCDACRRNGSVPRSIAPTKVDRREPTST